MPTEEERRKAAAERLRVLARTAVTQAKGNIEHATGILDRLVIKENNIVLERELLRSWRSLALRSTLSEAFSALRADGKFLPPPAPPRESWREYSARYDREAATAPT